MCMLVWLHTNQYRAMSVKFLAHWNNSLPLTRFEPILLAILKSLVRGVNRSTTPPPCTRKCLDIVQYFKFEVRIFLSKMYLLGICFCKLQVENKFCKIDAISWAFISNTMLIIWDCFTVASCCGTVIRFKSESLLKFWDSRNTVYHIKLGAGV